MLRRLLPAPPKRAARIPAKQIWLASWLEKIAKENYLKNIISNKIK